MNIQRMLWRVDLNLIEWLLLNIAKSVGCIFIIVRIIGSMSLDDWLRLVSFIVINNEVHHWLVCISWVFFFFQLASVLSGWTFNSCLSSFYLKVMLLVFIAFIFLFLFVAFYQASWVKFVHFYFFCLLFFFIHKILVKYFLV